MRTRRVLAALVLALWCAQSLAVPWQLWTGNHVIQFDSTAEGTGTTTFSWTHTPVGTLAGVLVACFTNVTATDVISGALYDGEPMTFIARAVDSATEIGSVEVYYLGTGVNTGAVSAQCTVSSGTDAKHGVSVGVLAPKDTEIAGSCTASAVANPSCTATVSSGASFSVASLFSGENSVGGNGMAANESWLVANSHDFGLQTTMVARMRHPRAGGNQLIATAVADTDTALVGAAIRVVP